MICCVAAVLAIEVRLMSALLGLVAAVYGLSMIVAAGGGLLCAVSPRFRRLLVDPR
jgi:hypothetical protein